MKQISLLTFVLLLSNFVFSQTTVINDIPRDTSFTLHSAFIKEKKYRPYIEKALPAPPQGVKSIENITYSEPYKGRKLLLNIYRPDSEETYPALLMVHGGGWSSGDRSLQIPMAQQIAQRGYVTIPVEYRLSPEAKYPAAVFDLKTAVRWIRANAKEYGIDPEKIAISGCSAGGQLAALVGTTNLQPKYEDKKEHSGHSSRIQAVVNIDGTSDFTTRENYQKVNEEIAKGKIPAAVKWLGGNFDEKRDLWIEASPIYHTTEYSAPICFINSSIPRFHDGRDTMISRLQTHNITCEVYTLPDTPHPFWLFNPWFQTTVNYITNYLDKVLK